MDATQSRQTSNTFAAVIAVCNNFLTALFRTAIPSAKSLFIFIVLFFLAQQYCFASISSAGFIDANQTICSGTAPATITNTTSPTGTGTLTYFWQQSTLGPFTGHTTIPATNSLTYSPGILTQTTWFRRAVTDGTDTLYSDPVKITVTPASAGGFLASSRNGCFGSDQTTLTTLGSMGSVLYWESSPNFNFIPTTTIANTDTILVIQNPTPTLYYRAVLQNGTCPIAQSTLKQVSTSIPTTNGFITTPSFIVCGNTNFELTLNAYTGTILYWESSPNVNFIPATTINSTASHITGNINAITYFRAVLSTGTCPLISSNHVAMETNPPTIGGIVNGSASYCSNTNSTILQLSGHSGNIMRWESSPSPAFTTITTIPFTGTSLTLTNITTTTYYRAVVQKTNCSEAFSDTGSIEIVTTLAKVSGGTTVCAPTNSTTLTLTGYTGSIIKWQSSLSADFSSATDIPNTTNSLTVTNLTVKTYYRAYVQNGSCPLYFSGIDSIRVHPATVGGTLSGGNTVCAGTNSTTLTLTGYSGSILNWQWSTSPTFASGINNISNTTNTYTATNLTATRYYRAVITSLHCAAEAVQYSSIAAIIVIPQAVGGILSGGAIVCTGTNSTLLTLSGYSGSIVKWESSPVANFSSGVINLANMNNTYTATNLTATTYYRAILSSSPCPADTSDIDSIVVTPQTVGGSILGGGSICPGNTSKILTLSGYTGSIIKWQSSTTSNFSANVTDITNTTNTYTASNLSVLTYYRVVVQSGVCSIVNSTTTSVSPPPIPGTLSGGVGYCSATNNTTFTLTGSFGSIIRWESCLTSDFSSGVTQISNNTASLNIINATVTTYYRVLVHGGGITCLGAYSNIDSIVIYPPLVGGIVSGSIDTVCTGNNSTTLTLSGYTGTIQWQSSTSSATTGFSNISGANSATYIANNLSVKTYYRAIVTSGLCASATSAVDSILINPIIVGGSVSGSNDTVCFGTNSTTLTLTGHTGAIQWQASTSSATTGFSNINGANAATYIATNLSAKTYFRAIFTNGSCPSSASAVDSVLINSLSVGGTISGTDSVCSGTNSTVLTLSGFTGTVIRWESANNAAFSGIVTQIANTTLTYTATNLSATTYYRAVVQNGNCPIAYSTVKAVIVVAPSFGGFITAPSTVCINTNSTVITITSYAGTILRWESSTTSNFSTITTIPHTGASYTAINITTPMYYRAVVQNGVCPAAYSLTGFINVQVQPNPGSVVGGTNVCVSSNSTQLTLVGYQGNIVRWESSNTADFSGTITTIANTSSTYFANNITTTTYYRAVVQYLNCATVNSAVAGIIVDPISVGGTVTSSNDTVCAGTNSTTLTLSGYTGTIQWQASTTSATTGFSNISGANASTYIATNLSVKMYYRAIVTSGACASSTSAVDSILINPISIGGTVSGNNDTVCSGTNSTTLTLSGNTGTIQWQASTSSATTGFSNISGANSATYITTNLSVKTYYRAFVTNGVCLSAASEVDSILVNPISVGGIVSGNNDTVCIGTNSTALTLSGYTGTIQWQASTTSSTSGFSNISGANTTTYIATNLSAKTYYRAIVTSGVCPSAISDVDSILINSISVGGIVSGNNDTVCIGTNSTALTLSGYTGTIQWQASTTSATSGFSNISGANSATYIATNLSVKTYYRAIVTSWVCPSAISTVDSILINPVSVGGIVSGNNDTVCIGTNSTTLTLTGFVGTVQWQASTTSATSGFSNIIGANSATYIATNLSVKTYFRAIVTSGNCPSATSAVDSILINPISVGGIVSGNNDTVCIGTNSTTLTVTGYVGSVQWQASITSATTGFSNLSGANSPTFTATNLSIKTYYRAIVTSGICPAATSAVDSILINPISVGGFVSCSNDTVCVGTNSTTLTLTGSVGTVQWQASTTSATTGFSNIVGANTSTYIASDLSVKTYYRAIVTSGNCPSATSAVDSILINPISVGGIVSGNTDTVCIGTNSTTLTLTGSVGTIQWQASTTSATSGFSNIIGATSTTYITTNLSVKTYYRAIVTSGICPSATSAVDSILINPISVGGIVSGNNDTVCIGTNSTTLTLTGSVGTIQWQVSTTSATTGFSNLSGANSSTFTATNLSIKTYYRAIVTSGICPSATSTIDSILINPISVGGVVLGNNDTVCVGTNSTTLTLTGSVGTVQWQASTTSATSGFSNIIGATSTTYIASNLSVKTYYRAIVTSGVCPSAISTVDSILISPIAVGGIVSGNNDTVCIGTNSTTLTLSGHVGTIQWQASTSSATTGFSNIIGATSPTYIATNLSIKTYYRAIVTSGVCPSAISTVDSILINPISVGGVVSGNNDTVCIGTNSTTLTLSGYVGTIQWQVSTTSATTGFSNIIGATSPTYTATNLSVKTYYRAILTSGVCPSATSTVDSIFVNAPVLSNMISGNMRLCSGDTAGLLTGSIPTGGNGSSYSYLWISSIIRSDSGFIPAAGINNTKDFSSGMLTQNTWFKRIVYSAPCSVDTSNVLLDTVSLNIVYSIPATTISIVYGTTLILPATVLVKYTDSTSDQRPVIWDTTGYSGNVGTYQYSGTIVLAPGTCNTGNINGSLTVTVIPRIIIVKANPKIKTVGTPDPTLTYVIVSGVLVGSDAFSGFLNRVPGEFVGKYLILQNTLSLPANYTLIYIHDTLTIIPRPIDLSIHKSADRSITQPSDTINYTIVVKNNGPDTLFTNETVFIHEYLPDSLTVITYTALIPAGSNYNQSSGAFVLGDTLSSGDSLILVLTGIIHPAYTQSFITNCVKVSTSSGVFDNDSTNDSAWVTTPLKPYAVSADIVASDHIICKGNMVSIGLSSIGIINPIFTWYADSMLTIPLYHSVSIDTLLLATTSFFITVKGDNKLENIPGTAKKLTIHVHDYASDTLILTRDTMVCYSKSAILIAQPKGPITNPVFTWYALPSLTIPIATGDTFYTPALTQDTLYYVTIKGSDLCESRELHIVKVTIDRDCGNINIGLTKALSKITEQPDGSYNLTFNFVTKNFGDEPLIDVKLRDDLKPVFPTAQIKVVSLTTPGNWFLNTGYDGINDIELLDTGNRFDVGDRQAVQLVINLLFPPLDTNTFFKNIAEISGLSIVNGKPVTRKSKDGIEPNPDSLTIDTSFVATPIVIKHIKNPKAEDILTLFIPEGFSPNGDQENDYFVIDNPDGYTLYVAIYNRWGNKLYENNNYDNTWNGKATEGLVIGEGVPDGTYFYIVEYTDTTGTKNKLAHSLTIVR